MKKTDGIKNWAKFQVHVQRAMDLFEQNHWRVQHKLGTEKKSQATIVRHEEDAIVVITYHYNHYYAHEEDDITIKNTALHEVLELFFWDYRIPEKFTHFIIEMIVKVCLKLGF